MSTTGPSSSELGIDLSKEVGSHKLPSEEKLKKGAAEGVDFMAGVIASAGKTQGVNIDNPVEIAGTMMSSGPLGGLVEQSKNTSEIPTDFDPKHPYGKEAAEGRLPKTNISKEVIVNLLTIEAGKDADQLKEEVENRIRAAELSGNFVNPEFINQLKEAVLNYNPATIPAGESKASFISKLTQKVETRGYLFFAEAKLGSASYKEASQAISGFLKDDQLNILWNENCGTPEKLVKGLALIMEEGDIVGSGAYWREVKVLNPGPPPIYEYGLGSKHAAVEAYLNHIGGLTTEDRDIAKKLTERLFKVTGMTAFYLGPIYQGSPGDINNGKLADEVIMEMVDLTPSQISGMDSPYIIAITEAKPEIKYMKNENYWNKWWELRQKGIIQPQWIPNPEKGGYLGDGSNLTRIFYMPEDMAMTGVTKAKSLRYAAESYVRSMPQWSGKKSLSKYIESIETKKPTTGSFRYGGAIDKGAEVQGLMTVLLNEPISGAERAGDLSQLQNNLGVLINTVKKFDEYLRAGVAPNILYYASSHLIEATFKYVNGNSKDRKKEFRKLPIFGSKTTNAVINSPLFYQYMDADNKKYALGILGASNTKIKLKEGVEATQGFGTDILQAFFKLFKF